MVAVSDGDPGEGIEKVSLLLKKIKDFVQTENPDMASPANSCLPSSGAVRFPTDGNAKSPAIPDDFRCPISLVLMKDPMVVSTGQTYERSCIKKWLDDGHGTCPKSQQSLTSTDLTPNYVLLSLIAQWCEANGIDPPKCPINSNPNDPTSVCSCPEHAKVEDLICKLSSSSIDDQCSAAGHSTGGNEASGHNNTDGAKNSGDTTSKRVNSDTDIDIATYYMAACAFDNEIILLFRYCLDG